jgi:hypothetical protein
MSLTTTEKKFAIGGILLASFCIAGLAYSLISLGFDSLDALQETSNRLDAAPYIKASVMITSKDSDGRLSLKSTDLPKGGDRLAVDRFAYGAASVGEVACVQYKRLPDDSQYGIEFVNQGSCK